MNSHLVHVLVQLPDVDYVGVESRNVVDIGEGMMFPCLALTQDRASPLNLNDGAITKSKCPDHPRVDAGNRRPGPRCLAPTGGDPCHFHHRV
jgi:hypothetical protein